MRANALMKQNIDALLRGRHQSRKDLAQWCRRSESWISKIFAEDQREFPMKYFDRIADFFGIATYQLLQPGVSHLTERRTSRNRRMGTDRRVAPQLRMAQELGATIDAARRPRPPGGTYGPSRATLAAFFGKVERELTALLAEADTRGQTVPPRKAVAKVRQGARAVRGSDTEKA